MDRDAVAIHRWPNTEAPTEAAIRRMFEAEHLQPYAWSNSSGDVYNAHSHTYHKVIYVVRGSITFGLPDEGRRITLGAGDRLDLASEVVHDAIVGSEGVVCLEAHRS